MRPALTFACKCAELQSFLADIHGGQHTRMDAGFLNVLHDTASSASPKIAERVDVDFDGILKEVVDKYRALLRIFNGGTHVAGHRIRIVGDDHGAATQDVTGADQDGIADALTDREGFFHAGGRAPARRGICRSSNTLPIGLRSSARSMDAGDVPMMGTPASKPLSRLGFVRRLHNHANLGAGLRFVVVDGENIFQCERLKIEAVGVVVGSCKIC